MLSIGRNIEHNGIEATFGAKPSKEVRELLKDAGFRWHGVKKLWYAKETPERMALLVSLAGNGAGSVADAENTPTVKSETKPKSETKANKFGVKVGDYFEMSWGYEQTNVDFFQVVALVGSQSVRIRQVAPEIIKSEACGSMAADRVYKLDKSKLLPPTERSIFIKDQENGDLKRLKSYAADGISDPRINMASYADAHYCAGETAQTYESWYY